jgi:hypothetical protein
MSDNEYHQHINRMYTLTDDDLASLRERNGCPSAELCDRTFDLPVEPPHFDRLTTRIISSMGALPRPSSVNSLQKDLRNTTVNKQTTTQIPHTNVVLTILFWRKNILKMMMMKKQTPWPLRASSSCASHQLEHSRRQVHERTHRTQGSKGRRTHLHCQMILQNQMIHQNQIQNHQDCRSHRRGGAAFCSPVIADVLVL